MGESTQTKQKTCIYLKFKKKIELDRVIIVYDQTKPKPSYMTTPAGLPDSVAKTAVTNTPSG